LQQNARQDAAGSYPEGRENHPADTPAVVRHGESGGAGAYEQGETIALIAAALIAPQPATLNTLATKSCQGAVEVAQPRTPAARQSAPAFVTATAPKRR